MPVSSVFGLEHELVIHVRDKALSFEKWYTEAKLAGRLLERFHKRFFPEAGDEQRFDRCPSHAELELFSLEKFELSDRLLVLSKEQGKGKAREPENDDDDDDDKASEYFWHGFMTPLGSRFYIDHGYFEVCSPECDDPFVLLACQLAHEELIAKEFTELFGAHPLQPRLYKNVSDGHGHSQAAHRNFRVSASFWPQLVSRWDWDMKRDKWFLNERFRAGSLSRSTLILATWHAVEQILTGAGKHRSEEVMYERSRKLAGQNPLNIFQVSGRADFIEEIVGEQTTNSRPIINQRHEPLANPDEDGRYHCISGDANRAEWPHLFKTGLTAILLGMLEDDACGINFYLNDPVGAIKDISLDLTMRRPVKILRFSQNGESELSPLEIMNKFLADMRRYVNSHRVPEWCERILDKAGWALWAFENEPELLERVLDWKIKERINRGRKNPFGLHLNYHALASPNLLYQKLCENGDIETVIPRDWIEKYKHSPPETTRAYFRGNFLKHFYKEIDFFTTDWYEIIFRWQGDSRIFPKKISMLDPLGLTKKEWGAIFEGAETLTLEPFQKLIEPYFRKRKKEDM